MSHIENPELFKEIRGFHLLIQSTQTYNTYISLTTLSDVGRSMFHFYETQGVKRQTREMAHLQSETKLHTSSMPLLHLILTHLKFSERTR